MTRGAKVLFFGKLFCQVLWVQSRPFGWKTAELSRKTLTAQRFVENFSSVETEIWLVSVDFLRGNPGRRILFLFPDAPATGFRPDDRSSGILTLKTQMQDFHELSPSQPSQK